MSRESLLEFPCDFPLKAMGRREADIAGRVREVMQAHVPAWDPAELREQESRQGNYVSVTVQFRADSQAQVDDIYRALTQQPEILFVL